MSRPTVTRMQTMARIAHAWAVRCFGKEHVEDNQVRALRLVEEAVELAQAVGCKYSDIAEVCVVVYQNPPGIPYREVGGVMLTLAVFCENGIMEMEDEFERELLRVLDKEANDPGYFQERNLKKVQPSAKSA